MIARIALLLVALSAIAVNQIDARLWSSHAPDFHPDWRHVDSAPLSASQQIILALKESNMDKLEKLFHEIHDPSHSSWLNHLTQQEIHDMTAMPVEDSDRIQNWLIDAGIPKSNIEYGLASGAIQFSATVKIINKLFNTTMAVFEHKKYKNRALAHVGDAHIPDHFHGLIEFADGLHFLPVHNAKHLQILEIDDMHKFMIQDDDSVNEKNSSPAVPDNSTAASRRLLQTSFLPIYPTNSLYSWYNAPNMAGFTKASGSAYPNHNTDVIQFWTGDGRGGVEQNSFSKSDLSLYSYLWSNTQSRTTLRADHVIGPNDESNPTGEPSLDIQSITAWNPKASANFENQPNQNNQMYAWATNYLGRANIPQVASISYGVAEVVYITGGTATVDGIAANQYLDRTNSQFMKIGLRGTTILASSGDDGANSEQNTNCNYASSYQYARYGLLADFPASSPYVTAVGGTAVNDRVSSHYSDTMTGGALMCNNFDTTKFSGYGLNSASSTIFRCFQSAGAVSRSSTPETVCSLDNCGITSGGGFSRQFAMPSWQTTAVNTYIQQGSGLSSWPTGLYNRSMRALPDVSMFGAPFPVIIGKTFAQVSGTSLAAPLFAAVIAQLNELTRLSANRSIGFANPLLYSMYAAQSSTFYDITSGNNNCPRSSRWSTDSGCISAGCKGFPAIAGWDASTGLGVPNVNNMLAYVQTLLSNGQYSGGGDDTGSVSDISDANSASTNFIVPGLFAAILLNVFVFALMQ